MATLATSSTFTGSRRRRSRRRRCGLNANWPARRVLRLSDLNLPSFEDLTVTRMLDQTAEAIRQAPRGPVALIGSSLGAFVAVHAAARNR